MKTVVLAEKPSQGAAYAEAFQKTKREDGYFLVEDSRFFNGLAYITWGFGHLVELIPPEAYKEEWKSWSLQNLPILPASFQFQVAKDKQKQFQIVKKLLKEANEIIVATDCDREGENIAQSIIQMAGASHKPKKRLWINSLEVDEIQKGFKNLKEGNVYLPLYREAQSRQFSDWLVGMNASRLYTLLLRDKGLNGVFSVGRVQTPTLYLIYKRQREIEQFKPQPFYEWIGNVHINTGSFEAKHRKQFFSKQEAYSTLETIGIKEGKNEGVVQKVERSLKKTKSPKLHSLSTLQGKANKLWKYSPSDVLKIAQSLYEKKLISYPRTDTHYITENEFVYIKENITNYSSALGVEIDMAFPEPQKRFVDGGKVQEHYALVPTKQVTDLNGLTEKEQNIYKEIVLTTLAMFAPLYEYEETKVEVDVNGLLFEKTGKVEKSKGWKSLFDTQNKSEDEEEKVAVLPAMTEGELCSVHVSLKEGTTQAPKPYTEGQLIQVMKQAGKDIEDEEVKDTLKRTEGIGTEATRASIIETLKAQRYLEVKRNIVSVTQKGKILCQAVEGTMLSSPEMTANWEQYLYKIGQEEGSQSEFLRRVERFLRSLTEEAPQQMIQLDQLVEKAKQEAGIGGCPKCGKGYIQDKGKFYGCSGYRKGCTFTLPKVICSKSISVSNAQKLIKGGKTALIKGFKSKQNKSFDAYLYLENERVLFEFPNKK
ncbi:type IA DNA topoisomerase [Pseudobacillus badius]|uniref:type IA DNA topoisomerase n=1 Tax=Bacillus badius TaxID=1455 RepID=UPI000596B751|nr:type IA DNA topoisomerase [Bacillus badius]KIL73868.1 DNA topoisomerase III [Bacillus badius]GLY11962.1 DNA topoisomerase [Bacillus badius]